MPPTFSMTLRARALRKAPELRPFQTHPTAWVDKRKALAVRSAACLLCLHTQQALIFGRVAAWDGDEASSDVVCLGGEKG